MSDSHQAGVGRGLVLLLCAAVLVFAYCVSQRVTGLQPDAVTYMDAAEQWRAGRGLTHRWAYWDPVYETCRLPTATTLWPPGYSLMIAGLGLFGAPSYDAARWIANASLVLLPLPMWGIGRHLAPPRRAWMALVCAMSCFPLLRYAGGLHPEPSFLLVFAGCIYATLRACTAAGEVATVRWLLMAGALAGAAFLVRYVGLSAIVVVMLVTIGLAARLSGRAKVAAVVVAIGPAVFLAGLWWLRNWMLCGGLTPALPKAHLTLADNLRESLFTVPSEWLGWRKLYEGGLWRLSRPVQLAAVAALILLSVAAVWREARRVGLGALGGLTRPSAVIALFLACYVGLTYAAIVRQGLIVQARYVTAIVPLALLPLCAWATRPVDAGWRSRGGTAACVVLTLAQAAAVGRWLESPMDEGYVARTLGSPVIEWVRSHVAPEEMLLTTEGAEIALHCKNPILRLPRRPHSAVRVTGWEAVDVLADRAGARYLVHLHFDRPPSWDDEHDRFLRSLNDPARWPDRLIESFPGHVAYAVGRRSARPTRLEGG